ncbi:MAG: radical SAM protein [Bacteroidales bacterium]|jgi:uncharacterized protein|nr:radical SAM protein [Bacteroidales bacterium]
MKKYKLSTYNFFKIFEDNIVTCMNLVEKICFCLSKEKYDLLLNHKDNIEHLAKDNPYLVSALYKLGLIIDAHEDETQKIIVQHRKEVYSRRSYRITILPTLNCNFKCWYCYEEHSKAVMDKSVQQSIIKHIKREIAESGVQHIQMDWFGGEPLMCFDDIVYPLSLKVKNICKKEDVFFTNSITTNGALFTSNSIKKIESCENDFISNYAGWE